MVIDIDKWMGINDSQINSLNRNGPLARYVKLRVAYAPGFSPPQRIGDPDLHHGTCVTNAPWCMSGSLITVSYEGWWRGKRSRHSRRIHNPQLYVSGKRLMVLTNLFPKYFGTHVAWQAPSHYLNLLCDVVSWTLGNKLQWKPNPNLYIFIQENASELMMIILRTHICVTWPQWAKTVCDPI